MFAQASAATLAASRTAALPVSVLRNSRSGVCRLRAQAVRPVKAERTRESAIGLAFHPGALPKAIGCAISAAGSGLPGENGKIAFVSGRSDGAPAEEDRLF
jgi:hypothetical protein